MRRDGSLLSGNEKGVLLVWGHLDKSKVCLQFCTLHNHARLTGAPIIDFSTHWCLVKPFPHLNNLLHF